MINIFLNFLRFYINADIYIFWDASGKYLYKLDIIRNQILISLIWVIRKVPWIYNLNAWNKVHEIKKNNNKQDDKK